MLTTNSSPLWLVTGAAGFIGSHVVEELLARGCRVRGLDDLSTGYMRNIDAATRGGGSFELIEGSIADPNICARACEGASHIIHLAALASVPVSIASPRRSMEVNDQGFVNVIDAARGEDATFVYASSSAVYGNAERLPVKEDDIGVPLSPYALAKANNERTADLFRRLYGMRCIGLRFFNVFGPRQDPNGAYAAVIPRWLSAFERGERPIIFGDGSATRDFCYVRNVVAALIAASEADDARAFGRAFNIACGRSVTMLELFETMRDAYGAPNDMRPQFQAPRPGDILHSSADISLAEELLGFKAHIAFEEGLRLTIDGMRGA